MKPFEFYSFSKFQLDNSVIHCSYLVIYDKPLWSSVEIP